MLPLPPLDGRYLRGKKMKYGGKRFYINWHSKDAEKIDYRFSEHGFEVEGDFNEGDKIEIGDFNGLLLKYYTNIKDEVAGAITFNNFYTRFNVDPPINKEERYLRKLREKLNLNEAESRREEKIMKGGIPFSKDFMINPKTNSIIPIIKNEKIYYLKKKQNNAAFIADPHTTIGKIYSIVDGILTDDNGHELDLEGKVPKGFIKMNSLLDKEPMEPKKINSGSARLFKVSQEKLWKIDNVIGKKARRGWDKSMKEMHENGDDELVNIGLNWKPPEVEYVEEKRMINKDNLDFVDKKFSLTLGGVRIIESIISLDLDEITIIDLGYSLYKIKELDVTIGRCVIDFITESQEIGYVEKLQEKVRETMGIDDVKEIRKPDESILERLNEQWEIEKQNLEYKQFNKMITTEEYIKLRELVYNEYLTKREDAIGKVEYIIDEEVEPQWLLDMQAETMRDMMEEE
jgi:hypothetical protein